MESLYPAMNQSTSWAVQAGMAGAMAAVFSKLALNAVEGGRLSPCRGYPSHLSTAVLGPDWHRTLCDPSFATDFATDVDSFLGSLSFGSFIRGHALPDLAVRVACLLCMVYCNAFMFSRFSRALDRSPSTASATAIATSSNYLSASLAGILLFGEVVGWRWSVGCLLITGGVMLIARDQALAEDGQENGGSDRKDR
eukprot:Clim_evm15s201 gene=Clim_evmTU15s201